MNTFTIYQRWIDVGVGDPEFSSTMAYVKIKAKDYNLTKNENIWSKSVQEEILVSTYPLAFWILQSWWRLLYEPLPAHNKEPENSWRMAHELGAAAHGFVWPIIVFASDSQNMHVWSTTYPTESEQSIQYLSGQYVSVDIPLDSFRSSLHEFVSTVLSRLDAFKINKTELLELYEIIKDEENDECYREYRKLEAIMGFDPDECDPDIMKVALRLKQKAGWKAMVELAPIFGRYVQEKPLQGINNLIEAEGFVGKPQASILENNELNNSSLAPWERAVKDARRVRQEIGNESRKISTADLFDLLGVSKDDSKNWKPLRRSNVSVGIPKNKSSIKFVPRKLHHISKRFELARYIADFIYVGSRQWLANTDLDTARQKYQRAFAAEFLCPINALAGFLGGDTSDEAFEDASQKFGVSKSAITALLMNNHYLPRYHIERLPYSIHPDFAQNDQNLAAVYL